MNNSYWQKVFDFLMSRGLPEDLVRNGCIASSEADQLCDVIAKKSPHNILEVGTFVGLSTGTIALACPPTATLVCVDPNLPVRIQSLEYGLDEQRGALTFVREVLSEIERERGVIMLEGFFSCRPRAHHREYLESASIPVDKIGIIADRVGDYGPYDIAFIDGDHCRDAVYEDLLLVHRHLALRATLIMHDVVGRWADEVGHGIGKFLREHREYAYTIEESLGFLERTVPERLEKSNHLASSDN